MESYTTNSQTSFSFQLIKDDEEFVNESHKKFYSKDVDFYDEQNAELKQIFAKPTCIVVFGKPGSGKTTVAKKLAAEWNLELINTTQIVTEYVESEGDIGKSLSEILLRGGQIPSEMVLNLLKMKLKSPEVSNLGFVLDDFPNLDDEFLTIPEQFEILKNLELKPDYIINIKIPDDDLLIRKTTQRIDSITGSLFTNEFFNPRPIFIEKKNDIIKDEEEEELIEENEEEEEPDTESPATIFPRSVVRPEDFCEFVAKKITKYNQYVLPLIENYFEDFLQQDILEIDGNRTMENLTEQIYFWLENLSVCKGFSPIRLFGEDSEIPSIDDSDEIFKFLAGKSKVSPWFPWRRSRYGVYCPVSLSRGNLVKGNVENAMTYMGKIYLFYNKESMGNFYSNPRKYLLPSCLRIPCKMWITGPPCSGKTTICNLLAKHYDASVVSMHDLIQNERNKKRDEEIEEKRVKITETLTASFHKTLSATFENVIAKLIIKNEENEHSGDGEKAVDEKVEEEELEEEKVEEEEQEDGGETSNENINETQEYSQEELMLKDFLGVETFTNDLIGTSLPPIHSEFSYLKAEIEKEVEKLKDLEINLESDLLLELLLEEIKKAKAERIDKNPTHEYDGKWIIDDFPLNEEIVNSMFEKGFVPDEIISLVNTEENYDLLFEAKESDRLKEKLQAYDRSWQKCYPHILAASAIQPLAVDVSSKQIENVLNEITTYTERYFRHNSWIYTAREMEEEADEDDDEEEAELKINKMRQFGELKHFCPIAFKDNFVLCPGNPEIPAKFRDKIYYFSSEEAREAFMSSPENYLPQDESFSAPPLRLCILGAHGSGKTELGKYIAEKNNLFFISFRDRLQEMIISKTRRIVGEPYFEPPEETNEGNEYVIKNDRLVHKKTIFLSDLKEKFNNGEYDWLKDSIPDLIEKYEMEEEDIKEKYTNKPDFNEKEEAIVAYLEHGSPLPNEILEEIISEWWNNEPFRSEGFVLEGFPRTLEDTRFLLENKYFPDAFVVLNVDQQVTLRRQLHLRMSSWEKRDETLKNRIEAKKEMNAVERELKMYQRRLILISEKRERELKEKEDELSDRDEEISISEEESVGEEADDIEAQLAEEFEDVELDETRENIEDARERIENEYAEVYDDDVNSLSNVLDVSNEFLLPKLELNANKRTKILIRIVDKLLEPYQKPRNIFERTYSITHSLAKDLLDVGQKFYSHFKKWCPVYIYENQDTLRRENKIPVIYRNFVYFLSDENSLNKFNHDPQKYLNCSSPKTTVPLKIAIFGPPQSGKSTVARKLCQNFGFLRVSANEALNFVLKTQPFTDLATKIDETLRKGFVVPDFLVCDAISVFIMTPEAKINGFVFDGYPLTRAQNDLLENRGIRLGCVINLVVSTKKIMLRGLYSRFSSERKTPLHDSALSLSLRLEKWKEQSKEIYDIYTQQYANLVTINGQKSKWWVWENSRKAVIEKMKNIKNYSERIYNRQAAPLFDLSITPLEFDERLTELREFCPVSLVDDQEFVDCSEYRKLDFAAEYRARYYKTASANCLEKFLQNPEKYIELAKLPEKDFIPQKIDSCNLSFPQDYEFGGYCLVSFCRGDMSYEALVEGETSISCKYRGKYYCFTSRDAQDEFLRKPEKFFSLTLPNKLPPRKVTIDINQLPILGYLEQSFASIIIKALSFVGGKKPKYPFVSPQRSACVLLAYYLKAHNSKSTPFLKSKYAQKLEDFDKSCELIAYLGDNMNFRTFEPEYRPPGFEKKFDNFFEIKNSDISIDYWLK